MTNLRILLVDDEAKIRDLLGQFLGMEGHAVVTADSAENSVRQLESGEFDLVVTDLRMPGMGGMGLLAWLQEAGPAVPAIVISAYGDINDAVQAMHRGAVDYLVKPFEPDELVVRIQRAAATFRMERSLRIRQRVDGIQDDEGASGGLLESANPAMRSLLDLARRAAPSQASILISGESGTGKEVLASWIHRLSQRQGGPFVPVNLGGVPENLLETELFGHEKGAFTGADHRKNGMFELANGGTLFLDEIGDMPLHLQVKLLRVLQDRKIQRLGSTIALPIDVRIIAASHRNLGQLVKEGRFREDLLYRLNVISLHIPPLRERPEDLAALVAHILDRHARSGISRSISPDALAALAAYPFPGNVRELENMLERALILCEGDMLRTRDFGLGGAGNPSSPQAAVHPQSDRAPPAGSPLDLIERWAIMRELEHQGGRRQATADNLGISRRTLLNKLNEYGLTAAASED